MKRFYPDEIVAYLVVGLFYATWLAATTAYFYLLFKLYW